jgi:hypothetical protein
LGLSNIQQMTRKWSNLNLPGALHYVTGNIIDRWPVFTNSEMLPSDHR